MRAALGATVSAALFFASIGVASAQSYGYGSNPYSHPTRGYTNQNGTYVQPHYQTNPNSTQYDNYGTRGNYNPYTGRTGTRTPKW
jgi:hypothetical protein